MACDVEPLSVDSGDGEVHDELDVGVREHSIAVADLGT